MGKPGKSVTSKAVKGKNHNPLKVKINSRTGKLTLKKNIKKCTIYVKATSKVNKNRKAKTKTILITAP